MDRVAELLAELADGSPDVTPSPELRDRVLAQIEQTPQESRPPDGDQPGSDEEP